MIPVSERFPEVRRCAVREMSRMRVVAAIATTVIIGACFLSITYRSQYTKDELFRGAVLVQSLVLLIYGTARAAGAVRAERQERTWDMQRLTPLSSFEIVVGKWIGTPLFAYFLAALMLPWAIAGAIISEGSVSLLTAFQTQAFLFSLAGLAVSTALLLSSHAVEKISKPVAEVIGLLLGFSAAYFFIGVMGNSSYPSRHVTYFRRDLPEIPWLTMSMALFAVWALMGAKWRIGRDLLEGGRFWHMPAFMAFLLVFQSGFDEHGFLVIVIAAAFFVYSAVLVNPEGREDWRRWLSGGRLLRDDAPIAVVSPLSYVLYAAFATEWYLLYWSPTGTEWRIPLLWSFFLVRDCAFLQACRFSKIRHPEMVALIFAGLSYALPFLVLKCLDMEYCLFFFAPNVEEEVGMIINSLPGLLQCAVMLSILLFLVKKQFRGAMSVAERRAPSPGRA